MCRSISGYRLNIMRAVSPHLFLLVTRCLHQACTYICRKQVARSATPARLASPREQRIKLMTDRCSFSRLRGSRPSTSPGRARVLTLSEMFAYHGKAMDHTSCYSTSSLGLEESSRSASCGTTTSLCTSSICKQGAR